jgi:hypothetical protein
MKYANFAWQKAKFTLRLVITTLDLEPDPDYPDSLEMLDPDPDSFE